MNSYLHTSYSCRCCYLSQAKISQDAIIAHFFSNITGNKATQKLYHYCLHCIDDDEREEKLGLVLLSKLLKKNDDLIHVYEEYPVRKCNHDVCD